MPLINVAVGRGAVEASCFRCGDYRTSTEAGAFPSRNDFPGERSANASGYLRENQGITITIREIPGLQALTTPTVAEKAMKLLVALTRRFPIPGTRIALGLHFAGERVKLAMKAAAEGTPIAIDDSARLALELQSRCWAQSFPELEYLFRTYLSSEGWVAHHTDGAAIIAPKGWTAADEMRRGFVPSDEAFVAMPFHPIFDELFTMGLHRGIRAAGYDPKRIDRVHHNNRIDDEIIARIRRCKFLVADFSLNRGGIYFEAGFALGLGRPVIWTAREDRLKRVHFDTRQYNFVLWREGQLDQFADALRNRIEATIGKGPLDNAI